MRLYAFYTPSHQILKDEWFVPTLQDNYELKVERYDQECVSGKYRQGGWAKTMLRKIESVVKAVRENWDEIFIYSDVDIQFFRPTKNLISRFLKGKDMVFQTDSPEGALCAGFFACRANPRTLKFWQGIRDRLSNDEDPKRGDQDLVNHLLLGRAGGLGQRIGSRVFGLLAKGSRCFTPCRAYFGNPYRVKWTYLPVEFFGGGTLTGRQWEPGASLKVPKNIVLHHANWTVGLENKIAQLELVRGIVTNRDGYLSHPKVIR